MKTIIISTDFSHAATNALHYAVNMALATNASILLFHVYQVPVSMTEVPVVVVSAEELKKNSEEKLQELIKGIEHITSGKLKVYGETTMGDIVDELEILCQKIQPFVVVMGTKGTSGLERVLFGSTTLTAIRHLTWPVIVVPSGAEFKKIKKIGFACDFKQVMETTPTNLIKQFVKEFDAELHVLNVDYDHKNFKPETPEQSLLFHTLLEEVDPAYHFIRNIDIEDGINFFAETNNLDLVITIPRKHKLLESLFRPASTRQLVFHSHIPVMCIHEESIK